MDTIFDKVLCATDLSWACSDIFRNLEKVRESGVIKKVRMLYVVAGEEPLQRQDAKAEALALMARMKGEMEGLGIPVETSVREGEPAKQIVKEASEWGASVIIISRVDKGVVEDIVAAGASVDVVRLSPVPVLVEKHSEDARGHVLKTPLWPLKKALVPLDVNEDPKEAVRLLKPMARKIVQEAVLAHIVQAGLSPEIQRDFELAAEAKLAEYAQEFERDGLETTVHVHRGEPAAGIVEIAVEEKAGLIIMPSRGPGRGKRGIGSVAEEMLKHSPVPVIFLPAPYQSALRAA